LVSCRVIMRHHLGALVDALRSLDVSATPVSVPSGEPAKELEALTGIYVELAKIGVDRQGCIIALGGGTVGDVAGFAAATGMRGNRYIQVPTTVRAMCHSSIVGKTAINLPAGKNLVGAVRQPVAIFADLEYLASLPNEEYRAALAEVVKAGMIADRPFVDWLVANIAGLLQRDSDSVHEAIRRAIRIKADVVARDPDETGERAILNYGHTVGHALERAAGYGKLRHGEAVAWGMEVAARLRVMRGSCQAEDVTVQRHVRARPGSL